MRKILLLKLAIISCFLLGGCWDGNEPERMHYVHGLGIDFKKGKYVVYLQLINLTTIGKTEGASTGTTPQADISMGSGKTFGQALYDLYKKLDRRVFWGHLSFIIFSKRALEQNAFPSVTDLLDRYRETKYRTFYYATDDNLKQTLLTSPNGNIPLGLGKLTDPSSTYNQSSLIRSITLRNVDMELYEPNHQIRIPFIRLTQHWDNSKEPKTSINTEAIAVLSGADNPKLYGIMSGKSILGLRWLEKGSNRDLIPLNKDGETIGTVVAIVTKRKITPIVDAGQTPKFQITIRIKVSIDKLIQNVSVADLKSVIAQKITSQVQTTYNKALEKKIDIYRLSEILYRKNNSYWKKIQVNGQIPLNKDSIQVTVKMKIKDTGKQGFQTTL